MIFSLNKNVLDEFILIQLRIHFEGSPHISQKTVAESPKINSPKNRFTERMFDEAILEKEGNWEPSIGLIELPRNISLEICWTKRRET